MNNQSVNFALVPLLLAVLASCAEVPAKAPPAKLSRPEAGALAPSPAGVASHDWPAAHWWEQFHDSQLDVLVQQALAESPSMAVAEARLRAAQSGAQAAVAEAGVAMSADGSLTRERFTRNGIIPPPYGGKYFYDGELQLNYSWDLDFWGRNRASIKAALGQVAAGQAEQAASAATLAGAVASTYFQWQALNARIALQQQVAASRTRLVSLEMQRVNAGLAPGQNLPPLHADAALPQQTLAQLSSERDLALFRLRSLVNSGASFPTLKALPLPAITVGLPDNASLDLLARRADIAAARDRVEATQQAVEANRLAFYPDFKLNAFAGLSSLEMGQMLHWSSRSFGVTPAIHLPVFGAPRLHAALAGSQAEAELAAAEYEQTLQNALAEVNDANLRLQGAMAEQPSLAAQQQARERELANSSKLREAGLADGREQERRKLALLALQDQQLSLQQRTLLASIDLIKALGGGYSTPVQP